MEPGRGLEIGSGLGDRAEVDRGRCGLRSANLVGRSAIFIVMLRSGGLVIAEDPGCARG